MAPAANAKRFIDRRRVECMFKMHCMDAVGRDGTPAEKAEVPGWWVSLKP